MGKKLPTRLELAAIIIKQPDGPQRTQHERWYWDLVAEECGDQRAANWQWEYEWLKGHR